MGTIHFWTLEKNPQEFVNRVIFFVGHVIG